MGTKGVFGYKLKNKKYLMYVQYDADMLWNVLIREIYVLLQHYGTVDSLRKAFQNLIQINTNKKPNNQIIEKCKMFTDLNVSTRNINDYYCLMRHCQGSFINILCCGYFLNDGLKTEYEFGFLLDFDENNAVFYNNESELNKMPINCIMNMNNEFNITSNYTNIIDDLRESYNSNIEIITKMNTAINSFENIYKTSTKLCVENSLDDENKKKLNFIVVECEKSLNELRFRKTNIELERISDIIRIRFKHINLI
jgi:hypothetical protein